MTVPHQSASTAGRHRQGLGLVLLWAALHFTSAVGRAQSGGNVSPSDVEAAYLYNFGKFIDWPAATPDSGAQFTICIVGKDEFGHTLDALIQNDTIKGHAIAARRLATLSDSDFCQIIYLSASEKPRLARDLDLLKDKPVLTVSDMPGFIDRGGMIQFVLQDNRVRFAVGLASAQRVHLALSSELLKVALYVNSRPAQEGQ